jgi:streptomycin 6-kinase
VTAGLRIPANLQWATETGGAARRRWLAALPARVDALAHRWGLDVGAPFEPGGHCSWVAPARDVVGHDLVLKVAWQHSEARDEAEGLAAVGGRSAVRVYAYEHLASDVHGGGPDGDTGGTTALLLERCRPGTALRERPVEEQHAVVVDVLRDVWSVELAPDHPFRPLSAMAEQWATGAESRLAADPARLDAGLARDGLARFRALAETGPDGVLLCTDLHAGNVLAATRRPWLLIDPKPYVGDRHYDVTQHLLNCATLLGVDPVESLRRVAALAGLDPERVRQWLVARCVHALLSDPPPWPGLDAVLARLGSP